MPRKRCGRNAAAATPSSAAAAAVARERREQNRNGASILNEEMERRGMTRGRNGHSRQTAAAAGRVESTSTHHVPVIITAVFY
jgi:hypothetical protein